MNRTILAATLVPLFLSACGGSGSSGSDSSDPTPGNNTPPTASAITVVDENGGQIIPGDKLVGDYQFSDKEGDKEGTSLFRWLRNGEAISGATGKTYTLSSDDLATNLMFEVTPVSATGALQGSAARSAQISVPGNSAPSFTALTFNKSSAQLGEEIVIQFSYSDADNDPAGSHIFSWFRNGSKISGADAATYTITSDDIGNEITAKVTAVATSGMPQGSEQSVEGAVAAIAPNEAPSFSNLVFDKTDVNVGDQVTIKFEYKDAEGDTAGTHIFRWYRDKVEIEGANNATYTVTSDDAGKQLTARATAVATSGNKQGAIQNVSAGSAVSVAVLNDAPVISNVTVEDKNGGRTLYGDTLTVNYQYSDSENDADDSHIIWKFSKDSTVADIPDSAGNKEYVISSAYEGAEIWAVVTGKAKTGNKEGNTLTSSRVMISHRPQVSGLTVVDENGGTVVVGDRLVAQYTYLDKDGDAEAGTGYSWFSNGNLVSDQRGKVYIVGQKDAGNNIKVHVRPGSDANEPGSTYISAPVTVDETPQQNLTFAQSGNLKAIVRAQFTNRATGLGRGAISYSSSDDGIAFVVAEDGPKIAAGTVFPLKPGRATITAEIAAFGDYPAASASYDVEVRAASMNVKTWVGKDSSTLKFSDNLSGVQLTSSSDLNCDLANPSGCQDYQTAELQDYQTTPENVDITALTLQRDAAYRMSYGNYQARGQLSAEPDFSLFTGAHFVEFKGKLWRFGGDPANGGSNEVWSSVDGRVWQKEVTESNRVFTPRFDHHVVEFKGRLWLTGGTQVVDGRAIVQQDIWSSYDGIDWTQNTTFADFSRYSDHSVVEANGKLWLSGGNSTNKHDLWASSDGINWSKQSTNQSCGGLYDRFELGVVKGSGDEADKLICHVKGKVYQFNNSSWTLVASISSVGGNVQTGSYSRFVQIKDKLFLVDPVRALIFGYGANSGSWSQYDAGSDPRNLVPAGNADVMSFADKIWVIGAYSNRIRAQSSTDGFSWAKGSQKLPGRYNSVAVVSNNKINVIGGIVSSFVTDTWQSAEGFDWQKRQTSGGLISKNTLSAVNYNDQMWVLQDNGTVARLNESSDSGSWQVTASTADGDFPVLRFARLVVHDNKLVLIATERESGSSNIYRNRVFTSENGSDWTAITTANDSSFDAEWGFAALSFNGSLWVIGGYGSTQYHGKVWQSTDNGKTWSESDAAFEPRADARVVELAGELWMYSGVGNSGDNFNNVWKSGNGTDWTKVTDNTGFPMRFYPAMVAKDDRLIIIGGLAENQERFGEIWSSTDGINWGKAVEAQIEFDPNPVNPL